MTQQRINIGKISTEYLGDWNSESSYNVFDVVTYNGAVYMAYKTSKGEYPDKMTNHPSTSYAVNTYWTTEMAFLRPKIPAYDSTIIQFLQIVTRNGKMRYANIYSVDYMGYFSNRDYMQDVIDFTKGY
jgi:hypothetical protein